MTRYGKEVEVFSKKEVLVSCGTVASAKLLLLSGVGPAPHLNQVLAIGGCTSEERYFRDSDSF